METADMNFDRETTHMKRRKVKIFSRCMNQDCDYENIEKTEEHICPICGWLTRVYGA